MIRCRLKQIMLEWQAEHGEKLPYQKLADATGTTVNFIYRMVHDDWRQISRTKLGALCAFFDCTVDRLLWEDDPVTVSDLDPAD